MPGQCRHDHWEVLHAQHAPGSFAADSKGIGQDIISVSPFASRSFRTGVCACSARHRTSADTLFQCQHLLVMGLIFQLPVEAAKEFQQGTCYLVYQKSGRQAAQQRTNHHFVYMIHQPVKPDGWIYPFLGELSVNLEKRPSRHCLLPCRLPCCGARRVTEKGSFLPVAPGGERCSVSGCAAVPTGRKYR